MDLPEEIYDLMLGHLSGSLETEDMEKLQQWLELSDEHQQCWLEIAKLWSRGKIEYRQLQERTSGLTWENIRQRCLRRQRRKMMKRWTAIAAMCVLVIGISFFFNQQESTKSSNVAELMAKRPVNQVTLVLSTGEQLKLGQEIQYQHAEVTIHSNSTAASYQVSSANFQDTILRYNELIVPVCGEYQLILSDSTHITLNAKSKLKFPVRFTGSKREIWLTGEAYLKVAHDVQRPFIVHTDKLDIQVLGTEFNVFAYTEDEKTEVTLIDGAVDVHTEKGHEKLSPGFQFSLNHLNGIYQKKEVDVRNFIAWKDGILLFDDISLNELMLRLERWYGIGFEYRGEELKQRKFTGGFRKYDNIEKVLEMIGCVNDVVFTVENDRVVIDRKR